uniref:ARAD1C35882p n=1 Tax=Blastobotrys adeninivorans TaxID=409370 RepID=A0A060T3R8_BLAAD
MTRIESDLEGNRVAELEAVLEILTKKLVDYAKAGNDPRGNIGPRHSPKELDAKLNLSLPAEGQGLEGLIKDADQLLENSVVTWNAGFLDKLYASTNPVGIASDMLLSILNTNSHVFTVSPAMTLIENKVGHEYAKLFGFTDRHSGGLTFPGGSYSNFTSVTIARSMLYPETKEEGNFKKLALFASNHCHYSVEKAAIFCGMGSKSLFKVKVNKAGQMLVEDLEAQIKRSIELGYTPFYINSTAGTTVYGSFDDFNAIADIAAKYKMWLHVDGSWGGNVVFSQKQRVKLNGVERANSITVNPHKMLGVPTTCSFLLVPDKRILQTANSLNAPYLFHNRDDSQEELYDLADGTMGCGRRPDAVKLYMGWRWYGTEGYGKRIDHAFALAEYFARKVNDAKDFVLVSELPPPCLQICFFYAPGGKLNDNADANSQLTREIVEELHRRQRFLVDFAPDADGRGEFFRVVVNSPVVTSETIDALMEEIESIGKKLRG